MKTALFIGAHPDDELYALGTLKVLLERDYQLHEILFSFGENGSVIRSGIATKISKLETKHIRKTEHEQAMNALGVSSWKCLDVEDGQITRSDQVVWDLVSEIRRIRPIVLITHSDHDSHPDHIVVSSIVIEAVRKAAITARTEDLGEKYRVPMLLKVEGYIPEPAAMYIDISKFKTFKMGYMAHYQSQLSESLVRSTQSSDTKNGVIFGVEAAEAFVTDPSWPPLISEL